MDNHIYKSIEITGTSETSVEHAVEQAIAKASESVEDLRWFEVVETRGTIDSDQIQQWQVTIKVGFTLH